MRAVLDEIEIVNNKTHGYGTANFARNLTECYHKLAERDVRAGRSAAHHELHRTDSASSHRADRRSGGDARVSGRAAFALTLFTKGDPEEQKLKIDRSGLAIYFGHTAIVKEKDAASYAALIRERSFDPARSWMIGNSPKSDINPALEAGLQRGLRSARADLDAGTRRTARGPGPIVADRAV